MTIKEKINALGARRSPFLFAVSYDGEDGFVIEKDGNNSDEYLYNIRGKSNCDQADEHRLKPKKITFEKEKPDFDEYKKGFDIVKCRLLRGDSYLVNYTGSVKISSNADLLEIFLLSEAPYKLYVKDRFTCFSPEPFVRIKDNTISSFPMKGTIRGEIPDAEKKLLSDAKEAAEHATIVDLIRNDLGMVSEHIRVERYRYIERVITEKGVLLQSSSEIAGDLSEDWKEHIGDILYKLLPAGSISGAPKRMTMEIIREAETHKRGFYTGIMGYFDGETLDSAVMIRFIERDNKGQLYFKAGGGITAKSKCENEYNELIDKVYVPIY